MADDDMKDTLDGTEDAAAPGKAKGGALPEFLILILKIVAGALGAIILSGVVSIMVFNMMKGDQPQQTLVDTSMEYNAKPERLTFTSEALDIRSQTADNPAKSVSVMIKFGYPGEGAQAQNILTEINDNKPRIKDLIRRLIGQEEAQTLKINEEEFKTKIMEKVNGLLSAGQIREIVFEDFSVFEN